MTPVVRTVALLAAAGAGWAAAELFRLDDVDSSGGYRFFVTALLGFGLYASTRGIEIDEFRTHLRTVVVAVTLGVLAKAAFIFGVLFLVYREPDHVVLAIALAQIDPLSVAAVRLKSRMSDSGKALLAAWSSFDDPITVLLTAYFTAYALGAHDTVGAGLTSFGTSLFWNAALVAVAYLAHLGHRAWRTRHAASDAPRPWPVRWAVRSGLLILLLVAGFLAVQYALLLALAVIGLFFRPDLGKSLDGLTQVALYTATFAIGVVLVGGLRIGEGVVLGVAAYVAQIVVALLLTIPKVWRGDRVRLALGQQNGLTAIILALLLEPNFPGTIAVVAPAIIVVNLLHALCNGLYDRFAVRDPDDDQRPPVREDRHTARFTRGLRLSNAAWTRFRRPA